MLLLLLFSRYHLNFRFNSVLSHKISTGDWIPFSFMCRSQSLGFPGGARGEEPTCQCRRHSDVGLIPGSGGAPGGGHGSPLQYSCWENPMDRGAWRAAVQRAAKSRTRLKRLSTPAYPMETFPECVRADALTVRTCVLAAASFRENTWDSPPHHFHWGLSLKRRASGSRRCLVPRV